MAQPAHFAPAYRWYGVRPFQRTTLLAHVSWDVVVLFDDPCRVVWRHARKRGDLFLDYQDLQLNVRF